MSNAWFRFKQFTILQDRAAMKVTTDGCLFGAWVAEEIRSQHIPNDKMLDIGTGTGMLALMIAQQTSGTIDALEIDEDSYDQAIVNIKNAPWPDRIKTLFKDARHFDSTISYDIIFSNPPFYENELKSGKMSRNVAHHGEELLLDDLFPLIKRSLATDGKFFILLPYKRNREIKQLPGKHNLKIEKMILVRQSVNHDYFRIMIRGSHSSQKMEEIQIDELAISDENGKYTPEFKTLLKDYYLNL